MAKSKPRKKTKTKTEKPRELLGCGLVYRPGDPWRIDIINFRDFRDALGDELLTAFCRGFNVAHKLGSVIDLIGMNYEVETAEPTRFERNLHVLGLFSCGVVRELPEIVTEFRRAGVERFLSEQGQKRWARLERFQSLEHHKAIKSMRDELAFHAGSPAAIRRGVEAFTAQAHPLVHVFRGDGKLEVEANDRGHIRVELGVDVLMAGLAIDSKALAGAFAEIRDGHLTLLRTLFDIFLDVLRAKGARFQPLEDLPPTA